MSAPPPTYPDAWSNWWATKASRHFHLRDPAAAVRRLAPAAARLSDHFTLHRHADFSKLYDKPLPILAYGNYFLPQTYTRTRLVLHELLHQHHWQPPAQPRLLDLGSGSGGATRAVLDLLPHTRPTLVDRSKLNLSFARDFLSTSLTPIQTIHADLPSFTPPKDPFHLILASFSASELPGADQPETLADWLQRLACHLAPDGLLILIEPALSTTSTTLHRARDLLLPSLHVWAPCLHQCPCPMLAEGKYWCHEVRSWTVPPNVNRINNLLRRSVWDLKFSFLALSPTPPSRPLTNETLFRLVTPIRHETGKFTFRGCTAAGTLAHYDLLRRTLSPDQRRALENLQRGQILHAPSIQPLKSPHHHRIHQPSELLT